MTAQCDLLETMVWRTVWSPETGSIGQTYDILPETSGMQRSLNSDVCVASWRLDRFTKAKDKVGVRQQRQINILSLQARRNRWMCARDEK